jgi:hypothetical protein
MEKIGFSAAQALGARGARRLQNRQAPPDTASASAPTKRYFVQVSNRPSYLKWDAAYTAFTQIVLFRTLLGLVRQSRLGGFQILAAVLSLGCGRDRRTWAGIGFAPPPGHFLQRPTPLSENHVNHHWRAVISCGGPRWGSRPAPRASWRRHAMHLCFWLQLLLKPSQVNSSVSS